MVSPDKFKEICDRVFESKFDYSIDTLTGYKPVYDESGTFLGNNLLFQGFCEDLLIRIGPVIWRDDYFQEEEQVEEFAESVLIGIYDRINKDSEFLETVNRYKLDFVCNIDTSHKPYTYLKNLPYLPYDDFITECNIVKAGMAQYGLNLLIDNDSCLSDTSEELYSNIIGTVVRLDG